jgi:hypothetical protein
MDMRYTILMSSVLAMGLVTPGALADTESHRQAAITLLEVTRTQKMLNQMLGSVEQMMDSQLGTLELSEEGTEAMTATRAELTGWIQEFFEWERMKQIYVDIYVEVFSEEEIDEIVAFYQSPLGQKMISRMPQLMQKSMEKTQALYREKMPVFQKRLQEVCADLQHKYGE